MKKSFAFSSVTVSAMLFGCASQPLEDTLQPSAVKVAQQRGASELECPAATAEVLSKRAIQVPQATGWYESPRRAEYKVDVSGCGKRTTYLVACKKFRSACEAGPVPTATGSEAPKQLADELRSDAMKEAQQRGSKELACPAATPEVTRQETMDEGQTTGWYQPPHRAVYAVRVAGCGKETAYLVESDKWQKGCATAGLQPTPAGPRHPHLADELQPSAVQSAQEQGSRELECPAATAEVNRKATIEEPQMSGWYQVPYRALYTITVSGCGKQNTYLVACNKKEKRCIAGNPRSGP